MRKKSLHAPARPRKGRRRAVWRPLRGDGCAKPRRAQAGRFPLEVMPVDAARWHPLVGRQVAEAVSLARLASSGRGLDPRQGCRCLCCARRWSAAPPPAGAVVAASVRWGPTDLALVCRDCWAGTREEIVARLLPLLCDSWSVDPTPPAAPREVRHDAADRLH
jgi:hypothetical protein